MDTYEDLIGTPRYPLGHPGLKKMFVNSTRIEDGDLASLIRQAHARRPFALGQCYSNTNQVVTDAKGNGWKNIFAYAGWLVIEDQLPFHHAWAVLEEGGESKVIDISSLNIPPHLTEEFDKKISEETEERKRAAKKKAEGKPEDEANQILRADAVEWHIESRKRMNELFRPYETGDVIECRVWGGIPQGHVYIGCPCRADEAIAVFKKWHPKFGAQSHHQAMGQPTLMQLIDQGREDEARKQLEREMR